MSPKKTTPQTTRVSKELFNETFRNHAGMTWINNQYVPYIRTARLATLLRVNKHWLADRLLRHKEVLRDNKAGVSLVWLVIGNQKYWFQSTFGWKYGFLYCGGKVNDEETI